MSNYTYTITRDDIIKRALRLIGVVAQGETPTATQISEATVALNGLCLAWQADGMPLWAIKTHTMPLVEDKVGYEIGATSTDIVLPKPLKVLQAWYHNNVSNSDVPLRIVTQQQYNMLGNKEAKGMPVQLWYQPLTDTGMLTLYLVPDAYTEANITLSFVYQAPYSAFDASADVLDFPQEWYDAITYGLASRLAPEYGVPPNDRKFLLQEMMEIKQTALSFGTEEGSLYFQIERHGY